MAQNIHEQIAELEAKIVALKEQEAAQLVEKAKSFADAFLKKLEKEGISARDGLKAYCDLAKLPTPSSLSSGSKKRAARGTAAPKPVRPVETGVTYKDPATGATWKAGAKGRIVGWLAEYISAGRSAGDFVMNG